MPDPPGRRRPRHRGERAENRPPHTPSASPLARAASWTSGPSWNAPLAPGFPIGTQRYGWPLLLAAANAEALEWIFEAAKKTSTGAPIWLAHEKWVRAELLPAEGRDTPDTWSRVVTALESLERPHDLARVRRRPAEALLEAGGDNERARATELLRLAHGVADRLGARPLTEAVTLLARRARLRLTHAPQPQPDPVEALGLTGRERDVLRLVAAGRTNRRIAEQLFISPKTASVHVSNILAKPGVSGRREAAAVAHRPGLFPPDAPTASAAG